jgi:hypothetical protein
MSILRRIILGAAGSILICTVGRGRAGDITVAVDAGRGGGVWRAGHRRAVT